MTASFISSLLSSRISLAFSLPFLVKEYKLNIPNSSLLINDSSNRFLKLS